MSAHPLCFVIPPYGLERVVEKGSATQRTDALRLMRQVAQMRQRRALIQTLPVIELARIALDVDSHLPVALDVSDPGNHHRNLLIRQVHRPPLLAPTVVAAIPTLPLVGRPDQLIDRFLEIFLHLLQPQKGISAWIISTRASTSWRVLSSLETRIPRFTLPSVRIIFLIRWLLVGMNRSTGREPEHLTWSRLLFNKG